MEIDKSFIEDIITDYQQKTEREAALQRARTKKGKKALAALRKLDQARRAVVWQEGPSIPAYKLFSEAELGLALGGTNVIHAAVLAGDTGKAVLKRMVALDRYRGGSPEDRMMLAATGDHDDAAEDME